MSASRHHHLTHASTPPLPPAKAAGRGGAVGSSITWSPFFSKRLCAEATNLSDCDSHATYVTADTSCPLPSRLYSTTTLRPYSRRRSGRRTFAPLAGFGIVLVRCGCWTGRGSLVTRPLPRCLPDAVWLCRSAPRRGLPCAANAPCV